MDHLYDSAFIVNGARDYARLAFKNALAKAEVVIQPIFKSMFSANEHYPRFHIIYHANCRLPDYIDTSYEGYLKRREMMKYAREPDVVGKDSIKFLASAKPRKQMQLNLVTPNLTTTPSHIPGGPGKPKNRGTQSIYRETSAQTIPWQPDYTIAGNCKNTPEVLYLEELEWVMFSINNTESLGLSFVGPGKPYRTGDLPADFHTTEIINKKRHARAWMDLVEKGIFPRFMAKRKEIIEAVEMKDWVFREAEIDELQTIRLEILHRLKDQYRENCASKTRKKLAHRWANAKHEMETKIEKIRRDRDREIRKLTLQHNIGGTVALAEIKRTTRGGGSVTKAACDPGSRMYAPLLRNGYQASCRNATIRYDPNLIVLEDHEELAKLPPWLESCGQDLKKTCSGHFIQRNPLKLCERETKWSEAFLEKLHNELKKARLGAAESGGHLHVLKPRRLVETPRPETPTVEGVSDHVEDYHQAALLMQRLLRGRAVQTLMYEGRRRACELTQELKSTHGLQKEDKWRIEREEAKAREYTLNRKQAEQKDDMIAALLDEVCGETVSSALDFLEKELRRLTEERRHHAFILIALREKAMREAAEAGRRQKEERRRREHDEMFKQILGVTQQTVDKYLKEVIEEGIELGAENDGVKLAQREADKLDEMHKNQSLSTAQENELVAELVHQFLLPETHREAARQRLAAMQQARLDAVRDTLFNLLASDTLVPSVCEKCDRPLDQCVCIVCEDKTKPVETKYRKDKRWHLARHVAPQVELSLAVRYPAWYDIRNMLQTLVDEVVETSRRERATKCAVWWDIKEDLEQGLEYKLEPRLILEMLVDIAVGDIMPPLMKKDTRHYSRRVIVDATGRYYPKEEKCTCPQELPSEIRRKEIARAQEMDPVCRCPEPEPTDGSPSLSKYRRVRYSGGHEEKIMEESESESEKIVGKDVCRCSVEKGVPLRKYVLDIMSQEERLKLMPSELRELEEIRKCKCVQIDPPVSEASSSSREEEEDGESPRTSTSGTSFGRHRPREDEREGEQQ